VAHEWIGPAIGAASAVVVGVAGIVFTWLTGKQARDQAELTAESRLEHERTMAREARQQERLATAYVRLLGMAERIGQWAQMVKPMLDTIPPQPERPLPNLDEQAEAQALVNAFGSDEVREAFESWQKVVRKAILEVNMINFEQARQKRSVHTVADLGEASMRLENLRPSEVKAREALGRQINDELRAARTS
jgi:hypothetical protein